MGCNRSATTDTGGEAGGWAAFRLFSLYPHTLFHIFAAVPFDMQFQPNQPTGPMNKPQYDQFKAICGTEA